MAAPPRVAAWLRSAPDGAARVLHACADAVHLEVAGRGVSLVGPGGPGLPLALRSNLPLVSSSRAATPYVEGGILHWGGRVLVTGRLVDVRAPRFDAARVPKASPAVAMGTPRSRAAGLVAFAPRGRRGLGGRRWSDAATGLTPLGDDVLCGWLAAHRGAGVPTPEVDDAVRRLLPRTTTLSASLLDCALAGEVADPVAGLPPLPRYDGRGRRAGALESFGHSSGVGLAHGIDLALDTLAAERGRMSTDHVELRSGAYADSVTLLQVSRQVQQLPGVVTAQVAMATPLNLEVLERMGFAIPADATVNHLVVAVRLDDADGARRRARRGRPGPHRQPPRRRRAVRGGAAAHDRLGPAPRRRARWSLVSVPGLERRRRGDGRARGRQRRDDLQRQRARSSRRSRLKRTPPRRGLLVMGPDCGTAVVDGRRARLRQRRRPRTGRHRRGLGHRLPAGARAPGPCRRRRRHGVRRRWSRPVRRRRRARDPHGAGPARRRPRVELAAAGLQAAGRRGRRLAHDCVDAAVPAPRNGATRRTRRSRRDEGGVDTSSSRSARDERGPRGRRSRCPASRRDGRCPRRWTAPRAVATSLL